MPSRRTVRIVLLIGIGLLVVGTAVVWRLTWLAPAWWSPPDPDLEETAALADRVEYRLAEEAHKVRPQEQVWRLRVREQQINAWLAARLPEWVAHTQGQEWPQSLGIPQVHLKPGAVTFAISFRDDDRQRYAVATLLPQMIEGELALVLDGVALGRMWIPGGSLRSVVSRADDLVPKGFFEDPNVERVLEVLLGRQRLDPRLELADGRRVRLRDLHLERGEAILECQTAPGGPASPPDSREAVEGR